GTGVSIGPLGPVATDLGLAGIVAPAAGNQRGRGCRTFGKTAPAIAKTSFRGGSPAACLSAYRRVFANVALRSPLFLGVQTRVQGIGSCQRRFAKNVALEHGFDIRACRFTLHLDA